MRTRNSARPCLSISSLTHMACFTHYAFVAAPFDATPVQRWIVRAAGADGRGDNVNVSNTRSRPDIECRLGDQYKCTIENTIRRKKNYNIRETTPPQRASDRKIMSAFIPITSSWVFVCLFGRVFLCVSCGSNYIHWHPRAYFEGNADSGRCVCTMENGRGFKSKYIQRNFTSSIYFIESLIVHDCRESRKPTKRFSWNFTYII